MRIPENAAGDRSLLDLRATDADSGENAMLDYELSQLSDWRTPSPFRADAEGQLRLKPGATLDREAVALYSFEVVARDRGRPQRSATAAITVTVTGAPSPHLFCLAIWGELYDKSRCTACMNSLNSTESDIIFVFALNKFIGFYLNSRQ